MWHHPWPSLQTPHGCHHGRREGQRRRCHLHADRPCNLPPLPPPWCPMMSQCQRCACCGDSLCQQTEKEGASSSAVPRLVTLPMVGFKPAQHRRQSWLSIRDRRLHPCQAPTGCPGSPQQCHPSLTVPMTLMASPGVLGGDGGAGGAGGTDPGRSRYCRAWPAARGPRRLSLRAAGPRSAASWSWPLARRSLSTGSMGTTPPRHHELQHSTAPSPPPPPPCTQGSCSPQTPRAPGQRCGTVPISSLCPTITPKPKPRGL